MAASVHGVVSTRLCAPFLNAARGLLLEMSRIAPLRGSVTPEHSSIFEAGKKERKK